MKRQEKQREAESATECQLTGTIQLRAIRVARIDSQLTCNRKKVHINELHCMLYVASQDLS